MSAQHSNISPRFLTSSPFHSSRDTDLIPKIIREYIRQLVDKNDLTEASELLLELMVVYAQKRINEVILLRRGITDIEQAARINILDFGIISRERNRLGLAILELADSVCS